MFEDKLLILDESFYLDDDLNEDTFEADYENKYNNYAEWLNAILKINNKKISDHAKNVLEDIGIEHSGRITYIDAEKLYSEKKYFEAMKVVKSIGKKYSQHDSAQLLYEDSETEILNGMTAPNSIEEYESYINTLDKYLAELESESFSIRKNELEKELEVFRQVAPAIEEAENYIKNENFVEAVRVLSDKSKDYPNEQHLKLALEDCQYYLIFNTAEKVKDYLQDKKYKAALVVIEDVRGVYNCDELNTLYTEVKNQSNPFYRFGNKVKNGVASVFNYFKQDVMSVKEEGGVKYVMRGGKKILLGDYSDEKVSLLSCTGNGVLSLCGLDAPLDVRDLTYDVQHIGEEEDWLVWLAVDTVALLPVVGTVKYAKYLKKTNKVVDMADDVSDASKAADNASDATKAVDDVSDTAKVTDNVSDAAKTADQIKDATKPIDDISNVKLGTIADTSKEVKHFERVTTINEALKGKKHPVTGVEFVESKVSLANGKNYIGVYPKFADKFKCTLPADKLIAKDIDQFAECTKKLQKAIDNEPKLKKQFSERQLEQIKAGEPRIDGLTWHHNEQEGVMQLVDRKTHDLTNHTGGKNLWGGGSEAR